MNSLLAGGIWTEEVRTRLAENGCVEALIPMFIRLNSQLKDAADKLEQAHRLNLSEARLVGLQEVVTAAFNKREVVCGWVCVWMCVGVCGSGCA
jgi:hypothetical protein